MKNDHNDAPSTHPQVHTALIHPLLYILPSVFVTSFIFPQFAFHAQPIHYHQSLFLSFSVLKILLRHRFHSRVYIKEIVF